MYQLYGAADRTSPPRAGPRRRHELLVERGLDGCRPRVTLALASRSRPLPKSRSLFLAFWTCCSSPYLGRFNICTQRGGGRTWPISAGLMLSKHDARKRYARLKSQQRRSSASENSNASSASARVTREGCSVARLGHQPSSQEKSRSDFDRLRKGLYVGRPDDPTLGMTSENAWNRGKTPPDLTCTSCTEPRTGPLPRAGDCTSWVHARPQTDRAPLRRTANSSRDGRHCVKFARAR